jgi:hypothetical protein
MEQKSYEVVYQIDLIRPAPLSLYRRPSLLREEIKFG